VKLPALPRGASVAKPSGTAPKLPVFALRATPRSPVAIPPRAATRGILAKASEPLLQREAYSYALPQIAFGKLKELSLFGCEQFMKTTVKTNSPMTPVPGHIPGTVMTPGYARSVGQIDYAWGWPMVNIQSRRLIYTQVMTLLAKAKGGRRRAPRNSAAMPPVPAAAGSSIRNAVVGTVVSVIFNASSTCHENRTIAFRIGKSGSSMNIKSYQLIVSIIGLSILLAQILFILNPIRGTSSWGGKIRTLRRSFDFHPSKKPNACWI